jgi:hypothetical protein
LGRSPRVSARRDLSESARISQIGPQMTKLRGFEASTRSKMANMPRRGFRCFIFGFVDDVLVSLWRNIDARNAVRTSQSGKASTGPVKSASKTTGNCKHFVELKTSANGGPCQNAKVRSLSVTCKGGGDWGAPSPGTKNFFLSDGRRIGYVL